MNIQSFVEESLKQISQACPEEEVTVSVDMGVYIDMSLGKEYIRVSSTRSEGDHSIKFTFTLRKKEQS